MRYVGFLSVLALSLMVSLGCGEGGGEGGSGGMAGTGGTAGTGGMAGAGGAAGMGGTSPPAKGVWTGTGDGPDGAFTICFVVNEEGTALVRPLVSSPGSTCSTDPTYSFAVEFDTCVGALLTTEEVPIVDGMFELVEEGQGPLAGYWMIHGTIDGSSASGDAEVADNSGGTCAGNWEAMLSE